VHVWIELLTIRVLGTHLTILLDASRVLAAAAHDSVCLLVLLLCTHVHTYTQEIYVQSCPNILIVHIYVNVPERRDVW
jgi:hypothetical protein